MGMPKRFFAKSKKSVDLNYRNKLNETHEMLKEMENLLKEKASQEFVKAVEFTRAKDETAAIRCLKSKKLYEPPIEHLQNLQLQIQEQRLMLEVGEAAAQTLDALTTGALAMKTMNINDVDDIMYNIKEQHETMKQTIEAVAAPFGAAAFYDEDELKAELAEMKAPSKKKSTFPAPPVPRGTDK